MGGPKALSIPGKKRRFIRTGRFVHLRPNAHPFPEQANPALGGAVPSSSTLDSIDGLPRDAEQCRKLLLSHAKRIPRQPHLYPEAIGARVAARPVSWARQTRLHLSKAYVHPTVQVKISPVRCAKETVLPPRDWTNEVVLLHFTHSLRAIIRRQSLVV